MSDPPNLSAAEAVLQVIVMGVAATLATDLWQRLLQIMGAQDSQSGLRRKVA